MSNGKHPTDGILTDIERERLEGMLYELENSEHRVVLVSTSDERHPGHKLRAVESQNPRWYTKFNSQYMNTRGKMKRPRTFIHKRKTILALERILAGNHTGVYADRILKFVRKEIHDEQIRRQMLDDDTYIPF